MATQTLSFSLTLMVVVGACLGQQLTLPARLYGEVGGNAVFTPSNVPPGTKEVTSWKLGANVIIRATGNKTSAGPGYENRAILNVNTLELQLSNLSLNDTGQYSLTTDINFVEHKADTKLEVFEQVTNVTVTVSENELVEFNSTVNLTCSASGTSLSFLWLNGSSAVTAGDRVELTDENKTLIITNVSRHDSKPFTCEASNAISKNTSHPLTLNIYYGPDNASVRAEPLGPFYCSGSELTLTCSAQSKPNAEILWAVNGSQSEKGPVLNLTNIQSSQSGSYTCIAHNTKTQRYFTSKPIDITVLERISGVKVTGPTDLLVEGDSAVITCEASGTIFSTKWMKDNQMLYPSDTIIFSSDNRTVTINPLDRIDRGEYRCTVSNPVSSDSASYIMTVHYGPDNVRITGPTEVEEEQSVKLLCTTFSLPEASFTWEFNGTKTEETTDTFTVERASFTNSGNYTCLVRNSVTGRDASRSHSLAVKVKGSLGGLLSAGAIAGIVIGVLIGIAGVAGLIVYFKKYKGGPKSSSTGNKQNGATQNGGEHELHYADIRHLQNNQSVVNMGGSNTQTRQGTPAMVRANRGTPQNQGVIPASQTEVVYSEVRK